MKSLGFNYKKIKSGILLTDLQKERRVELVRQWICEKIDMDTVVFSDECKFSLDGDDNSKSWSNENNIIRRKRPFGGGSIMVWGCIAKEGDLILRRLEGTLNSAKYCELLTHDILPILDKKLGTYIFQQDNARAHVSKKSLEMFTERPQEILVWPAYSPDLSPIEKVWSMIKQRVYNGPQYKSKDELWHKVEEEGRLLMVHKPEVIIDLYKHVYPNMCEILSTGGDLIK